MRRSLLAMGLALALLGAGLARAAPPEARYVGEKTCLKCHDIEDRHFGHTRHAKVFRQNPRNERERQVCEACHGPGSLHAERGNHKNRDYLTGFTRNWGTPVEKQNAACLSCHQGGERLHWSGSAHDTQKLACSDCHSAHGSPTTPLLKADSVNEVCYACHAETRGPMLWEHAPVRENCSNCHHPHGSNHDKLLVAARPFLCQQCHNSAGHNSTFYRADQTAARALSGGAQSPRVIGRSCQNCHSQIHGSNHPSGARFQR